VRCRQSRTTNSHGTRVRFNLRSIPSWERVTTRAQRLVMKTRVFFEKECYPARSPLRSSGRHMTLSLAGKEYTWQLASSHFPAVFLAAETSQKQAKRFETGMRQTWTRKCNDNSQIRANSSTQIRRAALQTLAYERRQLGGTCAKVGALRVLEGFFPLTIELQ
jgi:hypothetical protein